MYANIYWNGSLAVEGFHGTAEEIRAEAEKQLPGEVAVWQTSDANFDIHTSWDAIPAGEIETYTL